MYQIRAQCGWEIQVIGSGEKGLCRVVKQNGPVEFTGTYKECVAWLNRRAVELF